MNFLYVILYLIVLIFLLTLIYKRLSDISRRNFAHIWYDFFKKRNNFIFKIVGLLFLLLFILWSLVILTLPHYEAL